MIRRTGDPFYKTARWRAARAAAMAASGWACARCRAAGRRAPAVLVHHVKPIRTGGARYDPGHLEPLCRRCHDEAHAELDAAAACAADPCRAAWNRYIHEALKEAHTP